METIEREFIDLFNSHAEKYYCFECNNKQKFEKLVLTVECDNCASSVCYDCCLIFPHHFNKILVICNDCKKNYEKKLKVSNEIEDKRRVLYQKKENIDNY